MSRNKLRQLLASLVAPADHHESAQHGPLRLETLERRQLLAGDVELLFTDGNGAIDPGDLAAQTASTSDLPVTATAEGEAEPDLVQFAKDLATAGVQFFGANWCPACTQQKQLFEDGGDDLPFIEVTNPDRTPNSIAIAEGITQYPTWRFPDDSEATGVLSLATLSARSGVSIPQSETPTFAELGSQTVRIGSPLHLAVDGYDPDGNALTTTVTVDDPTLIEATVITGNRSLRIDMEGFGDMVFELFEQRAPRPAGRVADLADSDFYDGIIFHRVVNGFVIQAGDPTGTGSSGSSLGQFDDQFHPDLQHNRGGILSFAKTTDDTNNSQFFITETPTRHLDYNHSIFGLLVEGEDVREAISNMETSPPTPPGGAPTTPIRIDNASTFTDTENSVVMLKAIGGTGSTNVTITVTDGDGNTHSEVVPVTITADTGQSANSQPYLEDVNDPIAGTEDTPATLQLSAVDVEGDPVVYTASVVSGQTANATASVDSSGLVTVTPASGYTGPVDVRVTTAAQTQASGDDQQVVRFEFAADTALTAPTSIDLEAASDSGNSDSDDLTNEGSLTFTVQGVESGETVEIINTANDAVVGTATATGTTASITTNNIAALGDGTYTLAARRVAGGETSPLSPTLTITYDDTAPASVVGNAATQANVGREYTTDLINPEEGSGLIYALTNPPDGASIDAATGVITWTPTSQQLGSNTITVQQTDAAGNVLSEDYTVTVADEPVAGVRLEIADAQGNVVNSVATGDEFLLRFYGVDERGAFDRRGVFAAFADVLFDPAFVRISPGTTIEYSDDFVTVQDGTFGTGIIDELGAAQSRLVPTDEAESLIATVRFEALASGSTNFISEPADETSSEVLLYSTDDRIPANNVAYGSISLSIDQDFSLLDDTFTVAEDSTDNVLDVLDNDTVASGDSLSLVSVNQPASGGTVTLDNGEVRFTPTPDFFGEVTFTYTAANGNGIQDQASATVTVTNVNDVPVGAADTFTVDQGTVENNLDVLANDSFAPDENEDLTITAVGSSANGATIDIASDGKSVRYTPPANFTGADTFTYTLSDGTASTPVNVTVTVNPGDDPPTAVDDAFNVTEDDAEASFDVLSNDTRDGDNQSFVLSDVEDGSQGGTTRISGDGTQFFYTPAANFAGTETVRYTIRDTGGGLSIGTVTFTVAGVNDPPPAEDATASVLRSQGETSVLAIADLPDNVDDNETLRFTAVGSTTQGGTVRINAAEDEILYTAPTGDFTGEDTFTFTVSDDDGLTGTATMTVTVADFAPRDFLLSTDLGLHASFAGQVRLTGTNELGESVDVVATNENGAIAFMDQLPGTYRVTLPAIPFLQNGSTPQEINLVSGVEEGDETIEAAYGRLRPEYVSIRDWLGSARRQSILTAIAPGQQPVFLRPNSDTGEIESPEVELDADGENLTIRGVDDQDADVEATMPASSSRGVQFRGQVGDLRLLRLSVDSRDVSFASSSTSTSTQAASAGTTQLSSGGVQAEGESPAMGAVSLIDTVTPQQAASASRLSRLASQTPDEPVSTIEAPLDPPAIDASMPDVRESLEVRSPVAERLAERSGDESPDADSVDALLSEETP